eukprot:673028_1
MAQVSKALKFRALCAQLTPTETKLLINNVLDVNGTVLFSALFHLILSSCTYKDFDADDLNHMVSNIILSRKKKQKQDATVACPKIDGLPPALIGHTASFCLNPIISNSVHAHAPYSLAAILRIKCKN